MENTVSCHQNRHGTRTRIAAWVAAIVMAIAPAHAFAQALPARAIAPEDATVNLYCRFRSGNRLFLTTGSGVIIHERGVILTNAHVAQYFLIEPAKNKLRGGCSVRTGSPARQSYTASVLYFPSAWIRARMGQDVPGTTLNNDFALLYITGATAGELPESFPSLAPSFADNVDIGGQVVVSGYPVEKLSFKKMVNKLLLERATTTVEGVKRYETTDAPQMTETNLLAALPYAIAPQSSRKADLITLAHSAVSQKGVSGSPIVDGSNRVIGIVTSKSGDSDPKLHGITLSRINRAITSYTGLPFGYYTQGDFGMLAEINKTAMAAYDLDVVTDTLLKRKD